MDHALERSSLSRTHRHALSLGALFTLALGAALGAPARASAQSGVVIQPIGGPTVAPQAQLYVAPTQPGYVEGYGSTACPGDAILQPDRHGVMRCMRLERGHRVIWGLAGAGIGLLAGGWVWSILTTSISSLLDEFEHRQTYVGWGFVPIVGPWVQMTDLPPGVQSSYYAYLSLEGLLQDAGLILLIAGLVGEDAEEYRPIAAGEARVRPVFGASTQGFVVEGAF